MSKKPANIRDLMNSPLGDRDHTGFKAMDNTIKAAQAQGISVASDGRCFVKSLPNKKGFRVVDGKYVPRKG